jgi:TolB protein
MNADGSERRVLTRFPAGIFPSSPAWSPDGRTIAYARLKLGRDRQGSGLYSVDVGSGEVHRLTREIDSSPSWSPDGRRIVFQRLTGFHISEITLMDRDGSNQTSLTSGGWSDATPAWRPH